MIGRLEALAERANKLIVRGTSKNVRVTSSDIYDVLQYAIFHETRSSFPEEEQFRCATNVLDMMRSLKPAPYIYCDPTSISCDTTSISCDTTSLFSRIDPPLGGYIPTDSGCIKSWVGTGGDRCDIRIMPSYFDSVEYFCGFLEQVTAEGRSLSVSDLRTYRSTMQTVLRLNRVSSMERLLYTRPLTHNDRLFLTSYVFLNGCYDEMAVLLLRHGVHVQSEDPAHGLNVSWSSYRAWIDGTHPEVVCVVALSRALMAHPFRIPEVLVDLSASYLVVPL